MTRTKDPTEALAFQYRSTKVGRSRLIHADCFEWMGRLPENALHAIVTDPPYGVKEYDFDQLDKLLQAALDDARGLRSTTRLGPPRRLPVALE